MLAFVLSSSLALAPVPTALSPEAGEHNAKAMTFYDNGQLAPALKDQVDAHLRHCAVCERFGGRFKRTVATLRAHLGAAPAVDEATYRRLIERWPATSSPS